MARSGAARDEQHVRERRARAHRLRLDAKSRPLEPALPLPEPLLEPQAFSIPEFCRVYKTSRSVAYGFLGDGSLRAVKIGRVTRIRREDAETWFANLATYKRVAPPPQRC